MDYTIPKSSKDESLASECARLRAENASLKMCCDVWCKRAKLHAGTTLGLVGLVRLARDHSMRMKADKEMLENRCTSLKRTLDEVEYVHTYWLTVISPVSSDAPWVFIGLLVLVTTSRIYILPGTLTAFHRSSHLPLSVHPPRANRRPLTTRIVLNASVHLNARERNPLKLLPTRR